MTVQRESRTHTGDTAPPALVAGDRLSRAEFERRYEAMPHLKKAELIEGIVYVPSPVNAEHHGVPDSRLHTWLGMYAAFTPGVEAADNSTVRLAGDNEPQPDGLLRVRPSHGGQSSTVRGYIEGAPELIAEVAATSASYDLHQKLHVYQQSGVREYVVWRTLDEAVDWFVLRDGSLAGLPPDAGGVFRGQTFPGLWLDARALLEGDMARVLAVLQEGLASEDHAAFVRDLAVRAERSR